MNIKFNPNHKENNNVKITSDRTKIGSILFVFETFYKKLIFKMIIIIYLLINK